MSPRIAARGLVVDDGDLLTVQYGSGDEVWYLTPGGGQQTGESLSETVHREVREETGYEVEVESLAFVRDYIPSNHTEDGDDDDHRVDHFFWCELIDDDPVQPSMRDAKQVGVAWLAVDDLDDYWFFPRELPDALQSREKTATRDARYLGDIR
ncbi:mutT/NUDIX family protein [Haloferax elongans ATCC BAA-1513]|uniref:MutT/NUDIX family protein n=1 Tax=Haloferax elongans ATCC BAA-1513 TaxID=1230453 RepID=M0HSR2_HALEO|nr:NUDIX domain-containing protein [Haloferax elongans]ELZ87630.1 mutT/NUDIX family protein [Haloferax elongans ATCC BAA-1513]